MLYEEGCYTSLTNAQTSILPHSLNQSLLLPTQGLCFSKLECNPYITTLSSFISLSYLINKSI